MIPSKNKIRFAIGLFLFCGAYWVLDSVWSYLSFEKNLSVLVFQEPMSYKDTLLLKVPPYQLVSRLMVTGIFVISGLLIAFFFHKQKIAEQEKIRLERQLQHTHKMESIGTLAGGIAHDFNNILYGALGYTELCMDDTEDDSLMYNNLEAIKFGLLRAKTLVQQILTFSRQRDPKIEPIKMAPVVDEAIKLLRSTIPTTIAIKTDGDLSEGCINGDPTQIHQLIINLSTNATHAMEEKGGVVKITLKNVEIGTNWDDGRHADFPSGAYLKLSVSDSGTGISPEDLNRIFDPFFTTKEQGKGTGLGLSVVHGIVESHKGRILVESFKGIGTQIEVYFPLLGENVMCSA